MHCSHRKNQNYLPGYSFLPLFLSSSFQLVWTVGRISEEKGRRKEISQKYLFFFFRLKNGQLTCVIPHHESLTTNTDHLTPPNTTFQSQIGEEREDKLLKHCSSNSPKPGSQQQEHNNTSKQNKTKQNKTNSTIITSQPSFHALKSFFLRDPWLSGKEMVLLLFGFFLFSVFFFPLFRFSYFPFPPLVI